MNKKRLIQIIIFTTIWGYVVCPIISFANEKKFELKNLIVKEKEDEPSDRPLFDLINNENLNNSNQNDTEWGNNPFFNEKPVMIQTPEPINTEPEPTTLNLFEYKVTAVWMINDKFKVLISGHILAEGDELNNIKVKKITQKEITVEKDKKAKTFRLGSIFYDFQI